ncbi:hypothetical protein CAFE_25760 [Caprobacter fermentans]|uniref:DUF3006 domain-containing protein n=1 Tax=Caproicibacter fermentans TaxID=2576756 RepID=A0A6N8I1Q6_9FIRM|nr:DUF3006 domain-containing protein [Caproicibacter fermentans]MVB11848.1 hypothetical protein [Caproicibacter fermentans]OCN00650.1 hypothetical protein A7X67_08920 [Clostridium sp. W14A]QNK41088.1 DUF3006 domain-containing protein [Caproicibacter fermentans]
MKSITISRMEGIYAICEDENQKYYAIEISELPQGASAGDVLIVDDTEGTLTIDREATLAKKKKKK